MRSNPDFRKYNPWHYANMPLSITYANSKKSSKGDIVQAIKLSKSKLKDTNVSLDEKAFYDPLNFTYPGGCHICEVEINPNTGEVKVEGMTAVDDVGKVINPMIVEGQIHGGLAQGIGQALLENAAYDSNGQLLSGSYMDYTMPRADNFVDFKVGNEVTLCTHNSLGVKGCGEVGAIGSPPAVINAVVDALSELGVDDISMPATSEKVWNAINQAKNKN